MKDNNFWLEISLNSYSFYKRKIFFNNYTKENKLLQLMDIKNQKLVFYEYNEEEFQNLKENKNKFKLVFNRWF